MVNIRRDFPCLERRVNGKPMVYFDNAATTQKPQHVIARVSELYSSGIANVHRAVNFLADEVTQAFEAARETIARFINAQNREVIFVSNATQAINIACWMLSREKPLRVLTTTLEHHSNLLPWLRQGQVEFVPWGKNGQIDFDAFAQLLSKKPDLVTVARASNFLGTVQPVEEMVAACRTAGVPVLVDASQSIAHETLDVCALQCDFVVFSGHKIYGPSGVGVLYIRNDVIETMRPVFLGGSMVKEVHAQSYTVNDIPYCFEAGTPNIEGVIGLAAALDYVSELGYAAIAAHENELVQYAKQQLADVPGLNLYGPAFGEPCAPLVPFQVKRLEANAVARILANRANIVVRSGFLCAQPAHDQLGIGPTVRASFALYNRKDEIDCMVDVLQALNRL